MKTIKQTLYTYAILSDAGTISFDISCSDGMDVHGWLLVKTDYLETEIEDIDYKDVIIKRREGVLMNQRDQLDLKLKELKGGR